MGSTWYSKAAHLMSWWLKMREGGGRGRGGQTSSDLTSSHWVLPPKAFTAAQYHHRLVTMSIYYMTSQ
jgi:hypothetical protein